MISQFKDRLKEEQTIYEANRVKAQLEITKYASKIDVINSQKVSIQSKIEEINQQIARRNALGNIDDIDSEILAIQDNVIMQTDLLGKKETEITNQENAIEQFRLSGETTRQEREELNIVIVDKRETCNNIQNNIDTLNLQNNQCNREISRLNNEIEKIKNSDTCPTCGRKYDNFNEEYLQNTINELKQKQKEEQEKIEVNNKEIAEKQQLLDEKVIEGKEIRARLDEYDNKISQFKQELDNMETVKRNLNNEKQQINNNIKDLQSQIEILRNKKDQILKIEVGNKEEFEKMLSDLDIEIEAIKVESSIAEKTYNDNNDLVEVVKDSIKLVTKEFRTYLLQNSLQYLNKLLNFYSSHLFSNEQDVIEINGDDTKLDIKLGNATYESLSGGEKTRVNIALLLAQKSLASIVGNIRCNLIVLDEVLGYCDSQAENNIIDLITKELEDLESVYMVSHKEIPIGYDKQLVIIKDKQGLSRIRD